MHYKKTVKEQLTRVKCCDKESFKSIIVSIKRLIGGISKDVER